MEKIESTSLDIIKENIKKMGELFPNTVTEGKINFDILRNLLGDEIEEKAEKYQFTWPGKSESIKLSQLPSNATLRPCKSKSKDWDVSQNLYVEGDNLEVLKQLQKTYYGKIKMIYIDPPYNTGHDFVYKDDFKDSITNYIEQTNQTYKSNPESSGRFHTDWLNMIYPRLLLARNLLSEEGLIFISIDENEIANLRKVCDEIFGNNNFIAQITLLCNPKGRSQDKYIANCHEYILIYSKNTLKSGSVSIPKSAAEISSDYGLSDEKGPYRELELRNTHRDFGKFNRPNLWYPFYVKANGNISTTYVADAEEVYPFWDDGFEGCWTWGIEKANAEIDLLTAKKVNGKTKIYRKAYAFADDTAPLKQVKSIWTENAFFTEKGQKAVNDLFGSKEKLFQAPKSVDMLKQCILMCQDKDAIILDFFGGSSTTAQAVMQLNSEDNGNRKFIIVQIPEVCEKNSDAAKAGYTTICDIGEERIRRAGEKIKKEWKAKNSGAGLFAEEKELPVDFGFKVFKLDTTNITPWDNENQLNEESLFTLDNVFKEGRTKEDILYEITLKYGIFDQPVFKIDVNGKAMYRIGRRHMIVCLEDNITDKDIEAIGELSPRAVVFKESGFKDDNEKINAEYNLKKSGVEDVKCV